MSSSISTGLEADGEVCTVLVSLLFFVGEEIDRCLVLMMAVSRSKGLL